MFGRSGVWLFNNWTEQLKTLRGQIGKFRQHLFILRILIDDRRLVEFRGDGDQSCGDAI